MNLDIQAKLVSKLLHDLIAPASSVANGVEMLESTARIDEEILSFMKEGATAVNEKLKMFRLVYGATGDPSVKELQAFTHRIQSFLKIYEGRAICEGDNIQLSPVDIRVLGGYIVTLSHVATCPFELYVRGSSAGVEMVAKGLKLPLKAETVAALTGKMQGDDPELSVHVVQPYLAATWAQTRQAHLECVSNQAGEISVLYVF